MLLFRCLIPLLCLCSLLLASGCRDSSAPQKIKGPNGVTMQRGTMSKKETEAYREVWKEQKRRQGMKFEENQSGK